MPTWRTGRKTSSASPFPCVVTTHSQTGNMVRDTWKRLGQRSRSGRAPQICVYFADSSRLYMPCQPTQRAARQTGEPCGRGSGGAVNVFGYREGWVETGRLLAGELDLRPSIGQTGGCQAGRHPPELFVWANGRHGFCGKGKPEFRGIGEPEPRVIGEPGLRVGGEPELRVCARREHWRGDTCTDRGKRPCEAARSSDPSACGSRSMETIATGVGARTQAGEGCRTAMCCGVTAPPTALAPLTHPGVADDGVLVAPSALPQLRSLRRVINGEPGTARHWLLQA